MSSLSTKELALKLGAVKKISAFEVSSKQKSSKVGQPLRFLIVLDFEATCWDSKTRAPGRNEIIEFPAVILDVQRGSVVDEFQRYVKPTENPTLSKFCRDLTGITQEQVDASRPIQYCLDEFESWIKGKMKELGAEFYNHADFSHRTSVQDDCAVHQNGRLVLAGFLTWSDWDLGQCLQNECTRKRIRKPREFNSWVDLRYFYRDFYKRNPTCLQDAVENVGLKFKGRAHSGIVDTRNTAVLAASMMADGCILRITRNIESNGKRVHSVPPPSSMCAILDRVRRKEEISAKRAIAPPDAEGVHGKKSRDELVSRGERQQDANLR